MQLDFDYSARHENNRHSQGILEDNADRLNTQCERVLKLLQNGIRLTVVDACRLDQPISDLRRRIKDLRDSGIDIKDELVDKKFKRYFIEGGNCKESK